MLSPSSPSSEEESRRLIAIGDDEGIDMGVEDVEDGIIMKRATEKRKRSQPCSSSATLACRHRSNTAMKSTIVRDLVRTSCMHQKAHERACSERFSSFPPPPHKK